MSPLGAAIAGVCIIATGIGAAACVLAAAIGTGTTAARCADTASTLG